MRYIGGKHRIAKKIADIVDYYSEGKEVSEPFCGALSATTKIQPALASDLNHNLIDLYNAIRSGWTPPRNVSEQNYQDAKNLEDSPYKTFVSIACSFGGKVWGGYAREGDRNFANEGANSLLRKIDKIRDVSLKACNYTEIDLPVYYCDPPYAGVTQGYKLGKFDSDALWNWARQRERDGAIVLISEFSAPEDFEAIASFPSKTDLRKNGTQKTIEKVFRLKQ